MQGASRTKASAAVGRARHHPKTMWQTPQTPPPLPPKPRPPPAPTPPPTLNSAVDPLASRASSRSARGPSLGAPSRSACTRPANPRLAASISAVDPHRPAALGSAPLASSSATASRRPRRPQAACVRAVSPSASPWSTRAPWSSSQAASPTWPREQASIRHVQPYSLAAFTSAGSSSASRATMGCKPHCAAAWIRSISARHTPPLAPSAARGLYAAQSPAAETAGRPDGD